MDRRNAAELEVEAVRLKPNGGSPNNPSLPLLVYRGALRGTEAGEVQRMLGENGWGGSWQDGVYGLHHFHSNAHEVLVCCAGSGRVRFGGPGGPVVEVGTGDVAILPAGTGHKREGSSRDFLIVGAYPRGQEDYNMMRGDPAEAERAASNVAAVPLPAAGPLYGPDGPLMRRWGGAE